MKKVIGLIGCGVVGGALAKFFSEHGHRMVIYDNAKAIDTFEDVLKSDMIFVAVPTPTVGGRINLDAPENVLSRLSAADYRGPVILKCTVLPGTTRKLKAKYGLDLYHNPEFLTERNAVKDFAEQREVILGIGHNEHAQVSDLFLDHFPTVRYCSYEESELAKYIHNVFLAEKVAIMNEFRDYAEALGIDDDNFRFAVNAAVGQGGVGAGHTKVPGPDGKRGFGGMCFPKDTQALLSHFRELKLENSILERVTEYNKTLRDDV